MNREGTTSEQGENKEKAAPVLEHRDGWAQQVLTDAVDASIITKIEEDFKHDYF